MIKFFRNIRQKLLTEGNTSKYLKYAIGEIILVVIGILIALSINNWNQNRLNKKLESEYCQRLLEDLKEDKAILQATLNYSHQVVTHAKNAILVFENSEEMNPNPVDNLIDMYQASQLQDPNSAFSTYKELIASGQINLIQNDNLKTALIRYYEVDWEQTSVFKLSNSYRENLRGKMPNEIQVKIREKCGDVYIKIRKGYEVVLPKNCEVDINTQVAKSVVPFLLEDDSLKKDLRYLIGNEDAKILHVNSTIQQVDNLITLFETALQ
ncbi:DUF6090 family protein [Seonamhaeicola maritimus]|uniref:DUF6090 family protein n=1 Tax=Seonamhaeicola maritimus TaxID=2591822 RepID=UPI002494E828|nr:DUF6090 family protein [Seonamhaeicola maritimus]